MAITINGSSNTITGLAAGGLPDGSIQAADLASGVGGKLLQVIQNVKTDVWSTTTQNTWTDIGGTDQSGSGSVFGINITPSATSSKILFIASLQLGYYRSGDLVACRLVGGGSVLSHGDAANNRLRAHGSAGSYNDFQTKMLHMDFLHSPNTTSNVLYKIGIHKYDDEATYINRSYRDYDGSNYDFRLVSTLTAMEVGA